MLATETVAVARRRVEPGEGKGMMFRFNIPGKCVQANNSDRILINVEEKNRKTERKLPAGVSTRQKENALLGV